jgi:hypothetical protein
LKVTGVQPNHGWRHLWREIVRGTRMKPELCDYMCGHEGKSGTGARYGKRKVAVLAKEMALFPRFKVPALNRSPAPHKRVRRTSAQIAADDAAMAARRAARGRPLRPDRDEDGAAQGWRHTLALAVPNITRIERYGKFDERPLCATSGPSSDVAFDPEQTSTCSD